MDFVFLALACSGPDDAGTVPVPPPTETAATPTGETGTPTSTRVVLSPTLGAVRTLSEPPPGGYHHHATVALGVDDYVVTWTSGFDPVTNVWAQRFDLDGQPLGNVVPLSDAQNAGQKPDVVRDGDGWLVAYDDRQGGIWLRDLDGAGAAVGPSGLLYRADAPVQADAVDLAVQPDGSGIAIWTEFGAPGMGPDDGRIVWRAFTAGRQADGAPVIAEASSKKASDADALSDGSFVAVWAIHEDHPTIPDEVAYQVRGAVLGGGSFRADDLEAAWPSRPAVAVGPDDHLAVSWRDKTASRGEPAGAYGRLLDATGAPLGPSVELAPGGDGDRVVVAWAGPYAVYAWQQSDADGRGGVRLAAIDVDGAIVLEPLLVSEEGGTSDERPSIDVREVHGGYEVLVIWETVGQSGGDGLRARVVTLEPRPSTG